MHWPVLVVVCLASAPLVWGACSEPPPAQTPSISIEDRGGTASGAPAGGEDSAGERAAKPRSTSAGAALDRATQHAIEKELSALPGAKGAPLSFAECAALLKPTEAALDIAWKASSTCKTDSDCVGASDGTCMTGMCGISVAKEHAAAFEAARKHIGEVACVPWKAGGCDSTYALPVPSCSPLSPKCSSGRCMP
jgi:hypothetical protein